MVQQLVLESSQAQLFELLGAHSVLVGCVSVSLRATHHRLQSLKVGGVLGKFGVEVGTKVLAALGLCLSKKVEGSGALFILEHGGKLVDPLLVC